MIVSGTIPFSSLWHGSPFSLVVVSHQPVRTRGAAVANRVQTAVSMMEWSPETNTVSQLCYCSRNRIISSTGDFRVLLLEALHIYVWPLQLGYKCVLAIISLIHRNQNEIIHITGHSCCALCHSFWFWLSCTSNPCLIQKMMKYRCKREEPKAKEN